MEVARGPMGSREYLAEVARMLDTIPAQLEPFVTALFDAYRDRRTVFLIGNGGSAAAATHFGQDLNKAATCGLSVDTRFRAIPLTDNISFITALANDDGYDRVFVEQLTNHAGSQDVLVSISGSGNSPNVLRAVEYAKSLGMRTLGVTGFGGGKLGSIVDIHVNIPSNDMGLVEGVHSVLFHLVVHELRNRISRQLRE